MSPSVDDKKYSADTRSYKDVIINDGFVNHFDESPISKLLKIKDICIYKPGDLNKIGKEGKTSWDSFSYALLMGHNVWTHIEAVQRANLEFAAKKRPAMMQRSTGDYEYFETIVDAIFAAPDRASSESIIEYYSSYWMEIVGTRGFKGKKTVNSNTMFNALYVIGDGTDEYVEPDLNEEKLNHLGES